MHVHQLMNEYRKRTASERNLIPSHLFWCTAKCIAPENIHTSPTEGFFSLNPHPLWKFHFYSTILSFKKLGFWNPLPLGTSINLSWGVYGYFLAIHLFQASSFSSCHTVQPWSTSLVIKFINYLLISRVELQT